MANMMNANFAPRLADAVTAVPKPPGEKSVLERVYKFTADAQDAVFASVPNPIGPTSRDTIYSPLWLVFWVTWKPGVEPQLLTSEEAILAAEEAGKVELKRTDIVINCPIVGSPAGAMPGVVLRTDSTAWVSASRAAAGSPSSGGITCTVTRSASPLCQPWAARVATSDAPRANAARKAITAITKSNGAAPLSRGRI